MGLNPSNRLEEGLKGFPTLGDSPFSAECKDMAVAELRTAGFPRGSVILTTRECHLDRPDSQAAKMAQMGIRIPCAEKESEKEWVWQFHVDAKLYGWKFYRAWYYWVAVAGDSDYHVPRDTAEKFNQEFRCEARVDGFAGGQDVSGPVDSYHVDTPRGLEALVELLKLREKIINEERMARFA